MVILFSFISLILIYLIVIIFFPVLKVDAQPLSGHCEYQSNNHQNIEYEINGEKIRSWLFLPEDSIEPVPGIILCNGFGGTKDIILGQYAERFSQAGFASLLLEYRHFGESDGQPRQFYSSIKQIEDIKASVNFLRSHHRVDPGKIFIWGTSAGGAYGITIAVEDHRIRGVMAQCSGFDHKKDDKIVMKREGMKFLFKLIIHAQRDKGRSRFGLSPHMIPLVGIPGSTAFLTAPGVVEGYAGLVPDGSSFRNELCPRIMLMKQAVEPLSNAENVHCPVLILVCEKDNLVAQDSHHRLVEILREKAEVFSYPIGHFDIYKGEYFQKAVHEQIEFIQKASCDQEPG